VWLAEIDGQSRTMDDETIFLYSEATDSVSAHPYRLTGETDTVPPEGVTVDVDECEWAIRREELVEELERRGLERYD